MNKPEITKIEFTKEILDEIDKIKKGPTPGYRSQEPDGCVQGKRNSLVYESTKNSVSWHIPGNLVIRSLVKDFFVMVVNII